MAVNTSSITRRINPENQHLNLHRRENLRSLLTMVLTDQ